MMFKTSLLICLILSGQSGFGQKPPVYSTTEGAIGGYDVVAYFKSGSPVKGFDSLSVEHDGAAWKFSSRANLDSFRISPDRFIPKYGGYCAYGVSGNYKAPTSPDAWTIVNNQLYL